MTQLGKYELHEQLGKGGFGTVYRAIDTTLGREVALKVLHPQFSIEPDFLERFRNEAKLVASLQSTHIVTIYELGEADARVFIAMEYLAGGSLKQKLEKDGPIPFDETVRIMGEICDGLQTAHEQGLIHRDIKPGNILFDKKGRVVIGDFGLARAIQASSASASSSIGGVGTPAYRAPELWLGKPPASPATDIYSLGCVLSEMLTGKALFEGNTTEETLTKHLITGPNIPESYPSGVPACVLAVVKKAVEKDSEKRYHSIGELEKALNEIMQGEEKLKPVISPLSQKNLHSQKTMCDQKDRKAKLARLWLRLAGTIITGMFVIIVMLATRQPQTRAMVTTPVQSDLPISLDTGIPNSSPSATNTQTVVELSSSETASVMPQQTITAFSNSVEGEIKPDVKCRKGPSQYLYGYDVVLQNQKIQIIGRNTQGTWINFWANQMEDNCWSIIENITFDDNINLSDIAVIKDPIITSAIYYAYNQAECSEGWNNNQCVGKPFCDSVSFNGFGENPGSFAEAQTIAKNFDARYSEIIVYSVFQYTFDSRYLPGRIDCPVTFDGTTYKLIY